MQLFSSDYLKPNTIIALY